MRPPALDKFRVLTPAVLRRWPLPSPSGEGGKEERGRVLVIAGSAEMPGAAILAGEAVLRAGAGKVRIATHAEVTAAVGAAVPESYVLPLEDGRRRAASLRRVLESAERASTLLIGPGMIDLPLIETLLPSLLKLSAAKTVIMDAFALPVARELLARRREERPATILLPHAGEMALLLGEEVEEIAEAPQETLRRGVEKFRSTIARKGAQTFISAPNEDLYVNRRGNPGLGTAGSGDVLAGVVAGLSGRGATPLAATLRGVWLHARAGEALARRVGAVGFLAREICREIPHQLRGAE